MFLPLKAHVESYNCCIVIKNMCTVFHRNEIVVRIARYVIANSLDRLMTTIWSLRGFFFFFFFKARGLSIPLTNTIYRPFCQIIKIFNLADEATVRWSFLIESDEVNELLAHITVFLFILIPRVEYRFFDSASYLWGLDIRLCKTTKLFRNDGNHEIAAVCVCVWLLFWMTYPHIHTYVYTVFGILRTCKKDC